MKSMILGGVLLVGLMTTSVKAMSLEQWDKLTADQKTALTKALVRGTRDYLESADRDSLSKFKDTFGETAKTNGEKEFLGNIDDRRSSSGKPEMEAMDVEIAFMATLKSHGIKMRMPQLQEITGKFKK